MNGRKRNIILFFEENDNARSISSKMVRLYMNRFSIDEEERFEITGIFNLAKVPKITVGRGDRRRRLWNVSTRNWNEDRQLIKGAFEKLKICTWLSTDICIFMGTSLYLDVLNNNETLNELVQNLGRNCSSSITILLTLLNGKNHELHTKSIVQGQYRQRWPFDELKNFQQPEYFNLFGQRFLYEFNRSESVNDDLENIFATIISTNWHIIRWRRSFVSRQPFVRTLYLYEMQSDDEIKTKSDLRRRSDDHQYLLSLCKVSTAYLK